MFQQFLVCWILFYKWPYILESTNLEPLVEIIGWLRSDVSVVPNPWRSTSKRTYNRWSSRHSMPCLKGGHPFIRYLETVIILVVACWCIGKSVFPLRLPKVRVPKCLFFSEKCFGMRRLGVWDVPPGGMCSQTIPKLQTFIPDILWIHHPHL